MAADKPDIHDIFNKAIAQDSDEERERYLDEACGNDPKVRGRVQALLRAHSEAGGFFGGQSPAPAATEIRSDAENLGDTIGPYKLLEQIGEGGFGIVYMADQQAPVRRRVALKIIKPGMDTKQVLARFQAELQALSLMDHPNIARALDAGSTDSGRPYFVMELVRGVPITEYCDQNNLPVHERLDLFVTVCHAVQHAHQKGIIHRDIKPSNVLVTMQDGRPVPKVIDFGVAKAIDRQLTQETIFTRFAEMIGTPLYMSPEQAEMTSLDIDTRSDVYSLGVLLYELLTGTTPFEKERLKHAAFDEIRRIIREEEPAKPSTRISTLGDNSAAVAAHRHAEPHRLGQLMRGDLDWIVMKALEKDRTRRYETANGLAMDLQRHLANEPVLAGPPSAAYRFRKFARRNRIALAMIAIVTAALLLGIVGTTWQAIQAMRERDRARDAEFLAQERLESERNARAAEAEQRHIAEAQRAEAEKMRLQAEANFRKARQAVDEYFTLVSESKLFDVPGLQPLRKQLLEAAQRYYQGFLDQRSSDPNVRTELAATCLRVAQVEMQNNRTDDSIQSLKRGLAILEVLLHEKPRVADLKQVAGFRRTGRILQFWELWPSDPPEAMRVTQQAIDVWEHLVREYPDVDGFQSDLATFYHYLGDLKVLTMDRAGALQLFQKACAVWEQLLARHPNDPEYRSGLADDLEYAAGQPPQPTENKEAAFHRALTLREGLVAEFPGVPEYRAGLANGISRFGNYIYGEKRLEESEVLQRRALELWEKLVADYPTFPGYRKRLANGYVTLSHALKITGRPQEAEKRLRQAVDVMAKLAAESPGEHGDNLRELEEGQAELVRFLSGTGRMKEAEAVWHAQVAVMDALDKLAAGKPDWQNEVGHGNRCLAFSAQELSLLPETEQALQKALTVFQKLPAGGASELDPRFFLADTYRLLANVLAAEHRPAEAEKAYGRAIEIHEMATRESAWEPLDETAWAASFLDFARFLKSTGRSKEVEPTYQRLIAHAKTLAVAFPEKPAYRERLALSQLEMAQVLKETGRLNEAIDVLAKIAAESPGAAAECLSPLAEARYRLLCELQAAGRLKEAEAVRRDQAALLGRLQASASNNPKLQTALGHAYRYQGAGEWSPDLLQDGEQSYRQAVAMFEQLSASDPSNLEHRHFLADTHRILGHLLVLAKRPEQAEKEFRRAIEVHETAVGKPPIEPRNEAEWATCYLDVARFLVSINRPREAEDVFRRLLSQAEALLVAFPGKSVYRERLENTYLELAVFLSNHQQPDEADKAYRKAIDSAPKDAAILNGLAWTLATSPNPKFREPVGALKLAQSAVELAPKSGYIWNTLGVAQYRGGDWKAAITALEKSMELRNGGDSADWFFVAMAHWQLGQHDLAQKWYKVAALWMDRHSPNNEEFKRFHAEAAALMSLPETRSNDISDDVAVGNALIELNPQSGSYVFRGQARADSGQWNQADEDFTKAIQLGPKNYFAWYFRALVRRVKDDMPGFQAACADMLKQFSKTEDAQTANFVAWTCALGPEATTDFAPAIALAEKAAGSNAKSTQFANCLGALLYRAGRFDEALRTLEHAERLAGTTDPGRSPPAYTWYLLAMTQHRLGHADNANKWFDKAREATDKALKEHNAGTTKLAWNRRLTLSLLRREAEEQFGVKPTPPADTKQEGKPTK